MDAASQKSVSRDALVTEARDGDASAFWQLAEDARPYLKWVAKRVLGDRLAAKADASDVVQQSLLLAFEHFAQFQGQAADQWKAWLVTIVRNQARDQRQHWHRDKRNVQREQALAADSSSGLPLAADTTSPSGQAIRREQAARLLAALEQLPPDYREVLQLRNFENLPYAVIATRMNRSEAGARQLWERAVCRLSRELGEKP